MPPGYGRRSAGPSAPSHAHDHEWECHGDESAFVHEDCAVFVHETCNYAEVTGSATCDRLDETFYEYGYECDAVRRHRYDIVGVRLLDEDENLRETLAATRDEVLSLDDGTDLPLAEIERAAAERLCEGGQTTPRRGGPEILGWEVGIGRWDEGPHSITVEASGETWLLNYERTETEVDEL